MRAIFCCATTLASAEFLNREDSLWQSCHHRKKIGLIGSIGSPSCMAAGGSSPIGSTFTAPMYFDQSRDLIEHPRLDALLLVKCLLLMSFFRRRRLLAFLLLLLLLLLMRLMVPLFLFSGDLFVVFHH